MRNKFKTNLVCDCTLLVKWEPIKICENWVVPFRITDAKSLGPFFRLFFRKFNSSPIMETIDEDEDVRAERFRVENGASDFDLVQLHRLTKTYQLIHKKIIAVNNISIGIPAGEVRSTASFWMALYIGILSDKNLLFWKLFFLEKYSGSYPLSILMDSVYKIYTHPCVTSTL